MNCEEAREQLLLLMDSGSDDVTAPDGVSGRITEHASAHIRSCAACGELARKLRRLESAVRSLPGPLGSAQARARFETRLASGDFRDRDAAARRGPNVVYRFVRSKLAVAAILLLCLGVTMWFYIARQNRAIASAETIDQVAAWNLSLSQIESPDERQRLYDTGASSLRQLVGLAPLDDDDRRIADDLLLSGKFLAGSQDPLADADHFSKLADVLVEQMDRKSGKSPKALNQLGQTYYMVVDKGVHRNLARAQAAGLDSPERQKRLEKIIERNVRLQAKLQNLLDQSPGDSKPQLRKALDVTKKAPRARKAPNAATNPSSNPIAGPASRPAAS